MRPSLLAACLALLLLAWPAEAQVSPSQPADAPPGVSGARTIMDAVFWAFPGDADETCMQLPPSQIAITLRLENVGTPQPVRYRFAPYWYRAADSPSEIDASITREPRTFEATLAGGRYCYAIVNEAEPPLDADITGSTGEAQLVAVRMTLTPR
jgi:hypothetical protein